MKKGDEMYNKTKELLPKFIDASIAISASIGKLEDQRFPAFMTSDIERVTTKLEGLRETLREHMKACKNSVERADKEAQNPIRFEILDSIGIGRTDYAASSPTISIESDGRKITVRVGGSEADISWSTNHAMRITQVIDAMVLSGISGNVYTIQQGCVNMLRVDKIIAIRNQYPLIWKQLQNGNK